MKVYGKLLLARTIILNGINVTKAGSGCESHTIPAELAAR